MRIFALSRFLLFFCLVGLCLFLQPTPLLARQTANRVPQILLINSYNYGYDWSDAELAGFRQVLHQFYPRFDLYVETLDTKKFPQKLHFRQLAELYATKYAEINFDVIVAMDNAAFEFARTYRQQLFADVPLLFCGINDFHPGMLDGQQNVSGVAELHDAVGTLKLAQKLLPSISEVFVVHDYTDTGLAMRYELESRTGEFANLTFRFVTEQPLEQTIAQIEQLQQNQIALILSYTVEKTGRTFSQGDIAKLLSRKSRVPIFATHREQLGNGVIGGLMLSGEGQGERVAGLAIQVLGGKSADSLRVLTKNLAQPMLDWQQLKKYAISTSALPDDALLINKPISFYSVSKTALWSLLLLVTFLTATLLVMTHNTRRRKAAEGELRESEERFRLLMEQAPEAIFVLDVDQGKVLDCNAKALDLFGCPREELIAQGPERFCLTEQPELLDEKDSSHLHDQEKALRGEIVRYQRTVETPEGEQRLCEVLLVHLPFKGRKLLRKSFIDISERVALQNQLHQAEKMQAIGQLAGGIAHDFNNQLSSILGHAEMLQRRLNDQRLLRYVELIRTAAKRSAELTQQLLDFSRKGQHLTRTTAINPLLHEVVAVLKRSVDKRITIDCCLNAGEAKVKADPTQLQNALLNLALNARDAMPDGGELTFFTDIVPLGKEFSKRHSYKVSPGNYLKICVSDTGCGMSKAVQQRIFEPFFTTKAMGKGTGMGLASVYGTVLSHKGHINVYSELGKGTTFHIYLPLALEQEDISCQDIPLLPVAGSGHILVVDDEELVRQMTIEMLEDLGYRVTEAAHGAEALKIYQGSWQQFDLVILDMIMPAMDGRDTFVAMREINPEIKAILCSGYSVNDNTETLLRLGFGAFVGKPFSSIELSHKIADLLNPLQENKNRPSNQRPV